MMPLPDATIYYFDAADDMIPAILFAELLRGDVTYAVAVMPAALPMLMMPPRHCRYA